MFCTEAPPLTKCRLNQLKSRGEMADADHGRTDLEWDAHCQSLGFAAPPALSLKPQSWVPTGGYDLSKSAARPPAYPPPAPPSPKDNVGDGGDLADDEGEEVYGEEGYGEEAMEE